MNSEKLINLFTIIFIVVMACTGIFYLSYIMLK
jgi:hypothetical protein